MPFNDITNSPQAQDALRKAQIRKDTLVSFGITKEIEQEIQEKSGSIAIMKLIEHIPYLKERKMTVDQVLPILRSWNGHLNLIALVTNLDDLEKPEYGSFTQEQVVQLAATPGGNKIIAELHDHFAAFQENNKKYAFNAEDIMKMPLYAELANILAYGAKQAFIVPPLDLTKEELLKVLNAPKPGYASCPIKRLTFAKENAQTLSTLSREDVLEVLTTPYTCNMEYMLARKMDALPKASISQEKPKASIGANPNIIFKRQASSSIEGSPPCKMSEEDAAAILITIKTRK